MEKPVRTPRKGVPRNQAQPCLQEKKTCQPVNDIRRQLGWGLVEPGQKGGLR